MEAKVSVIMSAFNAEKNIGEAIKSILNQSFKDFEFIIVNDNSTDDTENVIEKFTDDDKRIVYLKNKKRLKISKTLNRAFDIANGKYIALMDENAVSDKERLQKQFDYMEKNPECGALGASKNLPTNDHDINLHGLFGVQFEKSTVMLRKSVFEENNLRFNPEYDEAEDFELWHRAKKFTKFHNLNENLVKLLNEKKTSRRQIILYDKIYISAFKEIIDEDFYVPLFTKWDFTLEELKESFNVLGEMPLMKLKPDTPFTRTEISYACCMHMKNVARKIDIPNKYAI